MPTYYELNSEQKNILNKIKQYYDVIPYAVFDEEEKKRLKASIPSELKKIREEFKDIQFNIFDCQGDGDMLSAMMTIAIIKNDRKNFGDLYWHLKSKCREQNVYQVLYRLVIKYAAVDLVNDILKSTKFEWLQQCSEHFPHNIQDSINPERNEIVDLLYDQKLLQADLLISQIFQNYDEALLTYLLRDDKTNKYRQDFVDAVNKQKVYLIPLSGSQDKTSEEIRQFYAQYLAVLTPESLMKIDDIDWKIAIRSAGDYDFEKILENYRDKAREIRIEANNNNINIGNGDEHQNVQDDEQAEELVFDEEKFQQFKQILDNVKTKEEFEQQFGEFIKNNLLSEQEFNLCFDHYIQTSTFDKIKSYFKLFGPMPLDDLIIDISSNLPFHVVKANIELLQENDEIMDLYLRSNELFGSIINTSRKDKILLIDYLYQFTSKTVLMDMMYSHADVEVYQYLAKNHPEDLAAYKEEHDLITEIKRSAGAGIDKFAEFLSAAFPYTDIFGKSRAEFDANIIEIQKYADWHKDPWHGSVDIADILEKYIAGAQAAVERFDYDKMEIKVEDISINDSLKNKADKERSKFYTLTAGFIILTGMTVTATLSIFIKPFSAACVQGLSNMGLRKIASNFKILAAVVAGGGAIGAGICGYFARENYSKMKSYETTLKTNDDNISKSNNTPNL